MAIFLMNDTFNVDEVCFAVPVWSIITQTETVRRPAGEGESERECYIMY